MCWQKRLKTTSLLVHFYFLHVMPDNLFKKLLKFGKLNFETAKLH
jgi:hypothetical protein